MPSEKPEGYHEHHRLKRRHGDERPVNKLFVGPKLHDWIEKHPEESRQLGWSILQHERPEEVTVVIPDAVVPTRKPRGPKATEKARNRAQIQFRVPVDQREDGAGLFDDLWRDAAELLENNAEEGVATEGATGQYGQLLAVLYFFVTNYRPSQ